MHEIGGLVWVLIVIIGVVSSVVKNVRKSGAAKQRQPRIASMLQAAPPPPVIVPAPIAAATLRRGAASARRIPVDAGFAAPPESGAFGPALRLPPSFHLDFVPGGRRAGFIGGMFNDRRAFVRAIIAAEVLGKPKALQEQSIWSPRHSEPSI
ncbi:MAG: hypothetical protein M3R51_02560 [Candidatus Eremiobacteraeota bacterium]|nr:hypothetical protein [Candidatus Eremiobacteraeota bacterium]